MHGVDISLLRTFLDLTKTRHFGKTAENLYLTQSAVSARIKQLEDILGVPLFQRFRNNIQLTPQGERLIPHAELLINNWIQAVQEVSLPDETEQLVIGAPHSVWDIRLQPLPVGLIKHFSQLHLRCESADSASIIKRLQERTLDLGLVFDLSKLDEIKNIKLMDIELELYSTEPDMDLNELSEDRYCLVDWGHSFLAQHAKLLPHVRSPVLLAHDWKMALEFLRTVSGVAFLPKELAENQSQPLFSVPGSPKIQRELYLCHHTAFLQKEQATEMLNYITDFFKEI